MSVEICFGEIGDIPARTCLTFDVSKSLAEELFRQAKEAPDGTRIEVPADKVTKVYFCLDCCFETRLLQEMFSHQRADRHTWWQKIRRFFGGTCRRLEIVPRS